MGVYWVIIKSSTARCCKGLLVPSSLLSATEAASQQGFSPPPPPPPPCQCDLCLPSSLLQTELFLPFIAFDLIEPSHTQRQKYKKHITTAFLLGWNEICEQDSINICNKAGHCLNSESRDQGTRERHDEGKNAETNGTRILLSCDKDC